jgi:dephospho-CoA kinase
MTYIVGLTGGIGSGKSTVAEFFSQLEVPIIDADEIARAIVAPNSPLFTSIIQHFGPTLLQADGQLNRSALRQKIFSDPEEKKWLEALLHPVIDKIMLQKISEINTPYCLVVIPLLAEHYTRYQQLFSHVIVVNSTPKLQQQRAVLRDQDPLIDQIIASQIPAAARLKIADTVLENTGSLTELKDKVINLHNKFLAESGKK